jgi:hypothetical protein
MPATTAAASPARSPAATPAKPVGTPGAPPAAAAAAAQPAAVRVQTPAPAANRAPAKGNGKPVPSIDSTQTMRALVVPESADAGEETLLVIQLVLSEAEIAPETVPNLAIFNEFRLYTAVGVEHGKVMHALRLGFFTDEGPAEAVAGYLRSYFEAPTVTRITLEERERFAKRRVEGRKDSGDTGVFHAIELSSAPTAPKTSLADLSAKHRTGDSALAARSRDKARR